MTADEIRAALADADNIETIIKLVAATVALVESCGKAKNVDGYRRALELKLCVERAGGAILRVKSKKPVPLSKLGIDRQAKRWRGLADLSDADFEKRIINSHSRWPPGTLPDYDPPVIQAVAHMTRWQVDEHGVMSRQKITEGEKPSLKFEGHPA